MWLYEEGCSINVPDFSESCFVLQFKVPAATSAIITNDGIGINPAQSAGKDSLMANSHTRRRIRVRCFSHGKSPGSIYGYCYMIQNVHTAEKQGQISVPKWLLYTFSRQGCIPDRGLSPSPCM